MLLVISCISFTGCTEETTATDYSWQTDRTDAPVANTPRVVATKSPDYTISNLEQTSDTSNPYLSKTTVTGIVKNNRNVEKSFVLVKAEFFDASNVKLGFSSDYIDSIGPGQSAKFEITSFSDDIAENSDHYSVSVS